MRLARFNYLSERAQQVLEIPDGAEVINITDKFKEGGPIVVSMLTPASEEEKKKNRLELQAAIDRALYALL